MKIYIAHNFDARLYLRETVVPVYVKDGHTITSRWILTDDHVKGSSQQCAVDDIDDIESAGALILFAEQYANKPGRGKHIELGYALRAGKICIVIGASKNPGSVFYGLPNIRHCETIEETLKYL